MVRTLGIGLILVLTALSGYRGLSLWLADAREGEPGGVALDAPTSYVSGIAVEDKEAVAQRTGVGGALITIHNNMPATISIVSQPGAKTYRIPWGGGDVSLGDAVVESLTLVYHDQFWPYVYDLTCPRTGERHRIRMSELWEGRVPRSFGLRRGRLDDLHNSVVWIDQTDESAG